MEKETVVDSILGIAANDYYSNQVHYYLADELSSYGYTEDEIKLFMEAVNTVDTFKDKESFAITMYEDFVNNHHTEKPMIIVAKCRLMGF